MAKKNTPIQPANGNTQTSKLVVPPANPYNLQAVKRYIFNETGNIMLSSTELEGSQIADSVRDVFSEVGVFFAAMTKAISTTINPNTNQPYSLYNYNAIQNVVDGSGLFIHVTEEDIIHKTSSFGATFSKELIEGILGLATGAGALSFAQGMIASMGSAGLQIGGHSSSSDNKVANIIFVCEYLLGMPIVSAMVVYCDASENSQTFSVGPCFSETTTSTKLEMHKDTYMFVTPKFIKNYAGDLESVTTDQVFLEFVDYLQALVAGKPIITAVQLLGDTSEAPAPAELTVGTTYAILGAYLNNKGETHNVKVAWVGPDDKTPGAAVENAEIQGNIISFSPTNKSTPTAIGIYFGDGAKTPSWTLAVATPTVYTAISNSPTVTLSPSSITIPKDSSGSAATKSLTVSIDNGAGLTLDGFKGITVMDSNNKPYKELDVTQDTLAKLKATYTKGSNPAAASGTVNFTAKTKKGSGAGPEIPGKFDFTIS